MAKLKDGKGRSNKGRNSNNVAPPPPPPQPTIPDRFISVRSTSTTPEAVQITKPQSSVRVASPDLLLVRNETLPVDSMVGLVLDDIGGQEIINVSRTDLINGVNNSYQLIEDSLLLSENYSSKNLIPMPGQSDFYFNSQAIDFASKIPATALGTSDDFVIIPIQTVVNGTIILKNKYVQIIDVVGDGTNAAYTTVVDHGLQVGDIVSIEGVEPLAYNLTNAEVVAVPFKNVFELESVTTAKYVSSIKTVYFETDTGDLIIEVDNINSNESVEIEIINSLTVFDDTMY
jgi:hypothetical protein